MLFMFQSMFHWLTTSKLQWVIDNSYIFYNMNTLSVANTYWLAAVNQQVISRPSTTLYFIAVTLLKDTLTMKEKFKK